MILRLDRLMGDLPKDREVSQVWNGQHSEDGQALEVVDGPPQGGTVPDLEEEQQLTSPVGPDPNDPDPDLMAHYAKKLLGDNLAEVKPDGTKFGGSARGKRGNAQSRGGRVRRA